MATYTQYKGGYNNGYSSASNTVLNSKIPLNDDYIQFRSGDDQYVLVIGKTEDGYDFTDATVYIVDGASGNQTLTKLEDQTVNCNITNDYYIYSNTKNDYYTPLQRYEALCNSLIGFTLTGGIAVCVVLSFIYRLFSRR